MEEVVKINIDGKEVEVPAGINLIDAAEIAGIHIPNLCYMKGMKGVGACRLCLVEVEGLKAPVIACNTKVRDNMIVKTKTERVQEVRKFVIDLLLSMHPLDCMTCTKSGICNLQKYAYEFELKESSFTRKKFGYPVDAANPFIKRDPDYCILCGRCVRVCKEQGTNVLDFMGRGIESKVVTANDRPLQESECTFCGSCVDACPVNALLEADRWRKGREWEYEKYNSVCMLCGCACEIKVSVREGDIQKINSGAKDGSVEKYLCAYGRFGFDSLRAESRLSTPLKRVNGELKETTWEDAINIVSTKLKEAGKNTCIISSASITNEDAITLKRFATEVLKTQNIGSTISLYSDPKVFKNSGKADINSSDLIIVIGLNLSQWDRVLPAIDAAVRKRVNRGAKLIVLNEAETGLSTVASINLRGNEIESIKAIITALKQSGAEIDKQTEEYLSDVREITEEITKSAGMILNAKSPLILVSPELFNAASNLALIKGDIIAVYPESNARGVALMGIETESKSYAEMTDSKYSLLYIAGNVPLQNRPDTDFLIVQNSYMNDIAKNADIVLPVAEYLETSGTIIDYAGRIKHLNRAIDSHGKSKSHREIFREIAKKMGTTLKMPVESEIKKAADVKAKISAMPFEKTKHLHFEPDKFIETLNLTVINNSRLIWLKEAFEVKAEK